MFRRVLIANRGEIALRIVRGLKTLGVESAVVFSEADRDAPWLAEADHTICIGPARADASYLDAGRVLQAADQLDCQAVHPGYGFLAENAEFAARCTQQGLAFVGPPASAIRRMGNKAEAKRTMKALGLPTIPGSDGVLGDVAEARQIADRVGYPVLLKAVAGGGGKGMRHCGSPAELAKAFSEAALEAEKAFGNGALYLEKRIDGGRHIEFQVLCDAFGNGIHLGERECSIQRKHQKLVEESPSPALDDATRRSLGERVAEAAARSGYRNAGTIEFLRDADGHFYFMEMNTRLQVEHPVTEMVTGVDLVCEQMRIAANVPLSLEQEAVRFVGHAIEFRINAEDPDDNFRPDAGVITGLTLPTVAGTAARVRWDSAIREGYRIPTHYDSMIGKLIVGGPDRLGTLKTAREVLGSLRIEGVKTTVALHRRIVEDAQFSSGDYDIDHLPRSGLLAESAP